FFIRGMFSFQLQDLLFKRFKILGYKSLDPFLCKREEYFVDKIDWRRCAFDIEQVSSDRHLGISREIGRPKANRLIPAIDAAAGVMRRPACRILEKADRTYGPVAAQIEPMQRSPRHTDQIAGFH